jgi:hypothetical protein
MTDEEIMEKAKQAGIRFEYYMTNPPQLTGSALVTTDRIQKFAKLIIEEIEARS